MASFLLIIVKKKESFNLRIHFEAGSLSDYSRIPIVAGYFS
jgi:hypothetical protein